MWCAIPKKREKYTSRSKHLQQEKYPGKPTLKRIHPEMEALRSEHTTMAP
jgi:hypothetical protein